LAHGAGGRLARELVEEVLLEILGHPLPEPPTDAARLPALEGLPSGRLALSTDGFVVDPVEFPGGDLGGLSVCGTVNDLAVVGARPRYLTWSLILEEGTEVALLERITRSAAETARLAGVQIVAGDTKVVGRGKGDGVYATSAGIGVIPAGRDLGDHRLRAGDRLLCSGPLGDHGAAVLAARHGLQGPRSDATPLSELVEHLLHGGAGGGMEMEVRALHDPTRGGLVAAAHEVARRAAVRLELDEAALPVRPAVRTVCDLLGVDPLALACEGRLLAWVSAESTDAALAALRAHPLGAGAAVIGEVLPPEAGRDPVVLRTRLGQRRPLDLRAGDDLPRIC
jgi:hydrogenase expression/formation protein HypE